MRHVLPPGIQTGQQVALCALVLVSGVRSADLPRPVQDGRSATMRAGRRTRRRAPAYRVGRVRAGDQDEAVNVDVDLSCPEPPWHPDAQAASVAWRAHEGQAGGPGDGQSVHTRGPRDRPCSHRGRTSQDSQRQVELQEEVRLQLDVRERDRPCSDDRTKTTTRATTTTTGQRRRRRPDKDNEEGDDDDDRTKTMRRATTRATTQTQTKTKTRRRRRPPRPNARPR